LSDWRPTASFDALGRRAALLIAVRQFFAQRGVMEVETPLLASAPVTDPHIEAIAARHPADEDAWLYLQTSPEFAMKRLVAAGSGPIYQICKAFRRGERGRRHNPEFTMLEWYRPDQSFDGLIDDVCAIVKLAAGAAPTVVRRSYRDLFIEALELDPFAASLSELRRCARHHLELSFDSEDRDTWLQLLMSTIVEPSLLADQITVVDNFPASQAALARIEDDASGTAVARRFEVYYRGMELANGYDELRDADELVRRIRSDHSQRQQAGLSMPPIDRALLKAMQAGLPACVGVAMGFDRLAMLHCDASAIDEVLAFPLERV